jgi:hypothetical protein
MSNEYLLTQSVVGRAAAECRQLSYHDNSERFHDMTLKVLSDTHKRTNQYLIRQSVSGRAPVECRQLSVADSCLPSGT